MGVKNLFKGRRGAESFNNASGAGFLILLITVAIIFYILFLTPSDRAALLGEGQIPGTPSTITGGYGHLIGTTPLSTSVGKISYVTKEKIDHELASFTIYTQTDANKIADQASIYLKNSAFEKKGSQLPFNINRQKAKNLKLSFNVRRSSGKLLIYLNGELIFEKELSRGSPQPINLPSDLLKNSNVLYFAVSSPGIAFWTMNEYELENINIIGDITDDSHNFNQQKIYISKSEAEHIKKATISYYPDCVRGETGRLIININGEQVYYGTPDCNMRNYFEISPKVLVEGQNDLEFLSTKGTYIIDQLKIQTTLEDPEYPIYYFNLDEDLFVTKKISHNYCGKIDGVCPSNCEPYEDKDCCFKESSNNYWCDIKTNNPRDRCVNEVLASYVDNCPSGYEDRLGNLKEEFEGRCGDNNDGYCPTNCDKRYDKDCCFQESPQNYWCDDLPFTGFDSICTPTIVPSECDACPNGYKNSFGERPNCIINEEEFESEEDPNLKSGVNIILDVRFAKQDYKKVDFLINGYKIPVDTYNMKIYRNINQFIQEGTNTIEIKPRRDVTISQLKISIK